MVFRFLQTSSHDISSPALGVFVTDILFNMYCRPTDTELGQQHRHVAWWSSLNSMSCPRHLAATWASNTLLSLGIILNSDITKKKKRTKMWETEHWTDHKVTGAQCEPSAALCKVSRHLHSGDSQTVPPTLCVQENWKHFKLVGVTSEF